MKRHLVVIPLLLPWIWSLAGCSLFGIATKGEMRAAAESWETKDRATRERLASLREELARIAENLEGIEDDLGQRVGELTAGVERLESGKAQTQRRLDAVAQRLSDARQQLANVEGGLRNDMETIQGDVVAMEGSVTSMGSEVAAAAAAADEAEARTRVLGDSYASSLRLEREVLLRKLQETEALLLALDENDLLAAEPLARGGGEIPTSGARELPVADMVVRAAGRERAQPGLPRS